ncbi:hypothetical protein TNCV_4469161 [Trichonephila clavipes]|nr:hypothetical protein TNCV_4469161 [Trichonephila clavipes]
MRCRRLGGFQILKDGEIVTSVQEESDPVDDETDEAEDNNNESRRVFGYPNNRVSKRWPVPIGSDKRRSTAYALRFKNSNTALFKSRGKGYKNVFEYVQSIA